MDNRDRLRIAYKKLKAAVFFDKTQLPLRDQLVLFEDRIEKKLAGLESALFDGVDWEKTEKEILDSIGVLVYPKKLIPVDDDMAIFNSDSIAIKMDKPQYFIDLSPAGHILGVLWVLEFGAKLDQNAGETHTTYKGMYPHSYGNRLRKRLINPETKDYTYAPGLFEPYFSQYQSWRDTALDYAKARLNAKQDALILTLDFKSFFYSVDIRQPLFDSFVDSLGQENQVSGGHKDWQKRLNNFVFKVIERYSQRLRNVHVDNTELSLGNRNVLPIGFLPSNILSNVVLTPFDNAVIEKWNPVYYGRYVDDIIIVDKVETNSEIYQSARSSDKNLRLNSDVIVNQFLCKTGVMDREKDKADKKSGDGKDGKDRYIYRISRETLRRGESNIGDSYISVQDQKVRLFYFQSGATKALLNCFRSKIRENVSEFRLLPDLDTVIKHGDYSELFQIKNEDSINKLRSVTGIELDKFALAKFLGKYRKVGGMIQSKEEDAFAEDALMIFDERTLVENYTAWERLFEIFIVNHRLDIVEKLATRIISAINRYEVSEAICRKREATHTALLLTLHSALCRTLSLVWGKKCNELIESISRKIEDTLVIPATGDCPFAIDVLPLFDLSQMNMARRAYCRTRMVNKYVLPVPIDCLLDKISLTDEDAVELCSLTDAMSFINSDWHKKADLYRYYPYMFLPQDISIAMTYAEISAGKALPQPDKLAKQVKETFMLLNYPLADDESRVFDLDNIKAGAIEGLPEKDERGRCFFATHVDCGEEKDHGKFRVAIGNAALKEANFRSALDLKPERGYTRYSDLRNMIDEAIHNNVDLLVLPENYIPFEWIPTLSRVCANNQLALVTGVEHIITTETCDCDKKGTVYNVTTVILPYKRDDYKFAHIAFHNKVEYSPRELALIEGYRYEAHRGNSYQLFCWKDVWFPVYCCYELTSIRDRAVFQTYADLVVAVEWNRDVPYFGSIVESLARDMHCYCVQANSSDYGDSRVMQPTDSVRRDIIKTKGGKNTCILYDEIDIKALRDFQVKSRELQEKDGPFKQTPPDLKQNILAMKRSGALLEVIRE